MKISQLLENKHTTDIFKKNFPDVDLYHGSMDHFEEGDIITFEIRKSPTHTCRIFHNEVNKLSMQKFSLPIRSLYFTSRSTIISDSYGESHRIAPLGEFRMFMSHCEDMTSDLSVQSIEVENILFDSLLRARIGQYDTSLVSQILGESRELFKSPTLDFEEFNREIKKVIKSNVDDKKTLISFSTAIDDFCSHYESIARSYVDDVEEIKDQNDLRSRDVADEIMLYSPNGMMVEG